MGTSLFDLDGKIALVTGSTHGLGMAMAKGLGKAGATIIVQEQAAGVKHDRPQLDKLMEGVRDGDTVIVASLDRIADNTRHLLEIVESLNEAGASLRVIDIGIDTATPHGEALGVEPS